MKEMKNKKNYMSPMVEIMNARVERGFQSSGTPDTSLTGGQLPPANQEVIVDGSDFD